MKYLLSLLAVGATAMAASAFTARDVTVTNPGAGIGLAGTLTMPDGGNPRAAIVLATGSGSQDRDETVAGHKPFKAIAEYLSDRGYAVLRMDDRGVGQSGGSAETATTTSNITDVEAGLAWLDSVCAGIPAGVIGHSEGGQIAYRIAARNPMCRFIVTLAAPAWRGDSLVMSQSRAIATALTGRWDAEAQQRHVLDIASSQLPAITARPMLAAELSSALGDQARLPQVQEYVSRQIDGLLSPWYREFLRYDPAADIAAVAVPWLALNGAKDMQVLPANLADITRLNPKADTLELSGHNHLFQNAATGLPQEYATLPEPISPQTLEAVAIWLDKTVK